MNCTSWKSSWMKRREVRRNMQLASRKETSEYRQMSSNVNGNFSFILQRAAERYAGLKQTQNTHSQYFSAVLTWAVRFRVLWCRLKSWGWWRVAEPLSSTELCRSVRPQITPFHLYEHITCLLFFHGLFIDLHFFDTEQMIFSPISKTFTFGHYLVFYC